MLTFHAGILFEGLLLHAIRLMLLHSLVLNLGLLTPATVLLSNERVLGMDLLDASGLLMVSCLMV